MTELLSPRFAHHVQKLCASGTPDEFIHHMSHLLKHARLMRQMEVGKNSKPRLLTVRSSVLKQVLVDVSSGRVMSLPEGNYVSRDILQGLKKAYDRALRQPIHLYQFGRLTVTATHCETGPGEDGDVLIFALAREITPKEFLNPQRNWRSRVPDTDDLPLDLDDLPEVPGAD